MGADCAFFLSSTGFTTVCVPHFSADGGGLLILSLVNCFHDGFRAVLLRKWQRIAHSSAHRWLSRRLACHIAHRIARWIDYSSARTRLCQLFACRMARRKVSRLICGFTHMFHLSMTLLRFYAPEIARRIAHSFARRRLLSPAGSRTVFLCGWQPITHSCTRQRLSRWFSRRIAQQMARQIAHSFARQRPS